jgi:hypothetical protein
MLRFSILALALLIDLTITACADTSGCSQVPDLSSTRLSWAALRKAPVNPAHSQGNCRSYAKSFFEAVTARQVASLCKEGIDRERTLELLDFEIGAFNELLAALCSS